jgi:hypothetical protein
MYRSLERRNGTPPVSPPGPGRIGIGDVDSNMPETVAAPPSDTHVPAGVNVVGLRMLLDVARSQSAERTTVETRTA